MFDFLQWWDIVIDTETQFKFVLNQEFEDFNVKIIITNYKYLSTYVVLSRVGSLTLRLSRIYL